MTVFEVLKASPLLSLLITLLAYVAGIKCYALTNRHSAAQPVLIGMMLVIGWLIIADKPVREYRQDVQILDLLLGTATVALAVPIYKNFHLIKQHLAPILAACFLTGVMSMGVALLLAWLFGATEATLLSLAPKSITTPFAIGVSETIGGIPSLSATIVIITGAIVALIARPLASFFAIETPMAQGLAMGMNGHGIATVRAFELNERMGAFSALGMGLMGIYVSVLLPYTATLFFG